MSDRVSAQRQGVPLREGDLLLYEISRTFTDLADVTALAMHLLEGVVEGGGHAFVRMRQEAGTNTTSPTIAHDVLCEWCKRRPEHAHGGRLLSVLEDTSVLPITAEQFRERLVPPRASHVSEQPTKLSGKTV